MWQARGGIGSSGDLIDEFREQLRAPNLVESLQSGLIGKNAEGEGPFGARRRIYSDYVTSGRALQQIED